VAKGLAGGPRPETLPDLFIDQLEELVALSPWGELVYEKAKRELYAEKLWPSPSDRITMTEGFKADVQALASDRKRHVNERLDDLAGCIEDKKNPNRLDFKKLQGKPMGPSTHECDAWADGGARRIFCHFEGDTLVLDALDKGLH